jgi:hypothetical protein
MGALLGTWKVTLPGESFTWEPDEMMLSDWAVAEDAYGGTFKEWIDAIDARNARACQVLIWWLRSKKGITVALDDVDFKIRQLETEKIPDPEDEAAASPSAAATSATSSNGAGDLVTSTP